ncbi:hypothetical protein BJF84_21240 [Rhodococcus sp. CUA-806]|jgi:hypothetical protein|nr:hypothetical protein BJF84_21240 [Rhodococcus sp. CUA-806]
MWGLRRKNVTADSADLVAARKTRIHAQSALKQARSRAGEVERITTRSDELRARNHFGEAIDACMERK